MPVQHEVQAKYVVKDAQALASFGRMATAAQRINNTFNNVSRVLGGVAAVGGTVAAAFSFQEIIASTKEHLSMVKRISDLTKTDVKTADSLVEAFAEVGLRGEDAERIMLGMSRRSAMMDMQFQRIGMHVTGTRGMFQRLGIDIRKGIEPALVRMSALYKKGRIDVAQLGVAFGVPRQQALNMVRLLEQGPERIKEMVEEGRKFAVGDNTMRQFERMRLASNRAREALKRMQILIGAELLPVLADLMEDMTTRIRSWLPEVKKFAVFLRDNLQMVLGLVIKIGKVLLANYALMKFTGMGMVGWAGRGLAFARGGLGGAGGAASRLLSAGVGMLGMAPGAAGGLMPAMTVVMRVLSVVGRLSIIGVVALVAWKAFTAIRDNALGVRDILLSFWRRLQGHFAVIAKLFGPVAKMFEGDGAIGKFFTVVIVKAIEGLAMAIDGIMMLISTIVIFVQRAFSSTKGYAHAMAHPIDALGEAAIEAAKMHREAMKVQEDQRRATAAAERTTPGGRAPNHYDFRNSRFDITQKFEEGFDPDRIALAFSNDLANLGEKKLQSGFAPLFAVR